MAGKALALALCILALAPIASAQIVEGNVAGSSRVLANLSIQGATTKTLTESAATALVQVDVAAGSLIAGSLEYAIFAADATDVQVRSGILPFAAVNKAGTETCSIATVAASTEVAAVSVGTLTNTFTCTTTPTNGILLNANAVSSLTQTTLEIRYRVVMYSGTATVTGQ